MLIFAAALALGVGQATTAFPKPIAPPPAEFLNWPGFGWAGADGRTVPTPYRGPGDWAGVQVAGLQKPVANPTDWHIKIVVLTRLDSRSAAEDGTLRQFHDVIWGDDVKRIRDEVSRFVAIVQAETEGKVHLVPDLLVEGDSLELKSELNQTLRDYMVPRINGGRYEAEDGVFRGPYASLQVIHPDVQAADGTLEVNDTPGSSLSLYRLPDWEAEGILAAHMAELWVAQVGARSRRIGFTGTATEQPLLDPGTALLNPRARVFEGDWASLVAPDQVSVEARFARLKVPATQAPETNSMQGKLALPSWRGAQTSATIGTDPEKGSVLNYLERESWRTGGVALPFAGPIDVSKTPTLSFFARSLSRDPISLAVVGADGATVHVSLGRDVRGPETAKSELPFSSDGIWHRVSVDLRETALPQIVGLRIEPSPNARKAPKSQGPVEYSFADFQVGSSPADAPLPPIQVAPTSPDAWGRAQWAHQQTAPSPALQALLKDPSEWVQLNALQPYVLTAEPLALADLSDRATLSNDVYVGSDALKALRKIGTPEAEAAIRRVLNVGVIDRSRAEAGSLLADSKDPKIAPDLIPLLEAPSLHARITAVQALGKIPGEQSGIIRMTFLNQSDPELKIAVTRTADPSSDYQMRKLQWSAVNEGSDAVRFESVVKLLSSPIDGFRAEALKAVKDDSTWVRILVLRHFAQNPDESERPGIRLAVLDRSPRVRAAAIRALAALPKAPTAEDLGPTLLDRQPGVQIALAELSRKTGLKLPAEQQEAMKASPDPRVRKALEGTTSE